MNFINKFENFIHELGLSIKQVCLSLIVIVSLLLIVFNLNGLNFGIIALICWVFAFLDLARIKFKDYEIDFMTHKQALTADERKLFLDNYDLISQFQFRYWQDGFIKKEALDLIFKAYSQAKLYLPKDIISYLQDMTDKATKSFALHIQIEHLDVGDEKSELLKQEQELNKIFQKMNPVELYRKYIRIDINEKKEI